MNFKHLLSLTLTAGLFFLYSCGGGDSEQQSVRDETPDLGTTEQSSEALPGGDKGIGKFQNVELTHPLDQSMVAAGEKIYEVKCQSCHKLTGERVVGPGFKGVTDRRTPEWIMNFITNVDEMLEKDAEAQALLEVCMVRMPNQNLGDEEARAILEFLRNNDGKS